MVRSFVLRGDVVVGSSARCPISAQFDFVDPGILRHGMPLKEFAELRRTAPVWWNAQPASTGFDDGGFWVISKHEHIKAISRDPDTWSAHDNGVVIRFPDGTASDMVEASKALLISHDPPEHTRLRRIISRMFTPRAVAQLEGRLREAAVSIVREAAEKGAGDFVSDISVKLPIQAIADLIGVPRADREQVFGWANSVIAMDDPDSGGDDANVAHADLMGYAYSLAEQRRKCPADDIISQLVRADVDGEWMTEAEFGFFVVLLAVAGNETTRNAITHGMNAFLDHPDQWELFKRERDATAADEIVRWSTPVYAFQRTARRDVQLGNVTIKKGQRAGLFYGSANFDEDVFNDPSRFDITREPNPHLGFGGQGTHYCIGANLARLEIRVMFDAIADITPGINKVSEPTRLRSGLVNGVTRLEVKYR
jgi:cholest-4-en-3-one 26-monooxygenase